jgi:type IV pilus assembly protein PilF
MRPDWRAILVLASLALSGCGTATPRATKSEAGSAPSAAEVQVGLAQGYLRQGRLDIAMDRASKALAMDPRLPAAHSVAAIIYQRVGDDEAAGKHHARAVELAPKNGDLLNNYAAFLCEAGDYTTADGLFERALKDPFYRTPAVALVNRGNCDIKAGQFEEAERWLRTALEVDSANADALLALADLLRTKGDVLRARAFIERYFGVAPGNPEALLIAIDIETRLGDRRAAADYRERLRREFPDSPEANSQDGVSP